MIEIWKNDDDCSGLVCFEKGWRLATAKSYMGFLFTVGSCVGKCNQSIWCVSSELCQSSWAFWRLFITNAVDPLKFSAHPENNHFPSRNVLFKKSTFGFHVSFRCRCFMCAISTRSGFPTGYAISFQGNGNGCNGAFIPSRAGSIWPFN